VLILAILCDGCEAAWIPSYKDNHSETTIAAATKAGWQIAKNKKRADDLCPMCLAKQSNALKTYP